MFCNVIKPPPAPTQGSCSPLRLFIKSITLDIKQITLETNIVVFNCSLWEFHEGGNLPHWLLVWGLLIYSLLNISNYLPFTWGIMKF